MATTPQAKDDLFTAVSTRLTEDSLDTKYLDVIGNDPGAAAKTFYSLDDGSSSLLNSTSSADKKEHTMTTVKELVFIDRNVTDLDTLLAGLRPDVEAIVLSSEESAPAQIARAVKDRSLDAVHVVAHGGAGEVSFGAGALALETLGDHAGYLAEIGRALGANGGLMLWSCNTGKGKRGASFVQALALATGADVAAATDLVGAEARGGRWELDMQSDAVAGRAPLTAESRAGYAGVMGANKVTLDLNGGGSGTNVTTLYTEGGSAVLLASSATVSVSGNFSGQKL
jgi:large repetitive protein